MNQRAAYRRRAAGRIGPPPELVAAGLVVLLYSSVVWAGPLVAGLSSLSMAGPVPTAGPAAPAASAAAPAPTADPLRPGIAGVLEIDARLTHAGEDLKAIIAKSPFRGSEAAFVLRRIKTTLLPAADRVAVLGRYAETREIGAQLEILYANADTTVEHASDLALDNARDYREAASQIVDLFRDLPAIDDRLRDVVAARGSASAAPSAAPSAVATLPASGAPSQAAAAPTAAPSGSLAAPSANPNEMLRDPGFEDQAGAWTSRTTVGMPPPVIGTGEPLGSSGTRSLRIDVPASPSLAAVSIGQGPIALRAGTRYVFTIAMRSEAPRTAQLRVVGPAAETYGIVLVEVDPAGLDARLEFVAVNDQSDAALWIDLGGASSGTVWLDDASLTPAVS